MIQESTIIDIPFFDVDSCDVVWHGNYVKYFEIARCDLLKKIAYTYKDMRDDGYFFPVVDLHVKYVQALSFAQKIEITSTLLEWEHRLKIKYLVTELGSNKSITKAQTVQAAVKMPEGELCLECPPRLINSVNALIKNNP